MNSNDYLQNVIRAMKNPYMGAAPQMQSSNFGFNPYMFPGGCDFPCGESKELKLIKELLEKVKALEAEVKSLRIAQAPAKTGYMPLREPY